MKIKAKDQTAITVDAQEFAAFVEQVRHACSVALGDLLALGMPSPATSTGKLLLAALGDIEAIQKEMLDGMPEKSPTLATITAGAPMRLGAERELPRLVDFLTALDANDSALAKALRAVSYRCDGNEDSEIAFEHVWRRVAALT